MRRGGEILATLWPARASLRVTLARFLLWIAAPLAGVGYARQLLESSLAREPYFVDSPPALDVAQLVVLARRLWPALLVLGAAVALSWLLLQLLTAGALIRLERGRPERITLWRAIADGGARALLPYLRVAVTAALLSGLGAFALAYVFRSLAHHGEIAGWTGRTLLRDLPLARALFTSLWVSLIGVFAFWLRVLLARERRPRLRGAAWHALRLCVRRPFAALGFQWGVALLTLAAQAAFLLAWPAPPQPAASSRWLAAWLVLLFASAYAWQWRLRAALAVLRSG